MPSLSICGSSGTNIPTTKRTAPKAIRFVRLFINILPFPAFDGGRILFLLIEKIKGSPVKTETENLMKVQPKLQQIYNEVESYIKSYQCLEKENNNIKREVINLKNKNEKLNQENNKLTTYLKLILEAIKTFLTFSPPKWVATVSSL